MLATHGNFTTDWTITWQDIQRKKVSKIISPSYKNVVFHFRLELSSYVEGNNVQKLRATIFCEDGPLCSLDNCTIMCRLRSDKKILDNFLVAWSFYAIRGEGIYWPNFQNKDSNVLKNKYGLDTSDDLHYVITISIPFTSFDYKVAKPQIEQRPAWFMGIFECLEDVDKADYSDVRFVAGDGGTFYWHRFVVGNQSKVLKTMLKNPISEGEKLGVIYFPSLDTGSLKAILRYLYTGEYDLLIKLSVPLIIQVADFSEQYGLEVLKEASSSHLWEIVVENPKDAIGILRFADLHPDAKYLKDRAMNVIMENFDSLSLQLRDFSGGNDNDVQGNRLKEEFMLYTLRRVSITLC